MKTGRKLKILAAGDFHGDVGIAEKLAEQAASENVDLVLLNGDLVEEEKVEGVIGPFLKKNKRVFFVHGNHESLATAHFLADFYGITHLHGYGVKYGNVGIFGCGGANIGLDQLAEEEIFNLLKEGHEKVKGMERKIMVTHVHPAGSHMEKFSEWVIGSKGLKKALDMFKPDILICGHVHEAEGIEEKIGNTRVLNVGKSGKIIEV